MGIEELHAEGQGLDVTDTTHSGLWQRKIHCGGACILIYTQSHFIKECGEK